MEMIFDEILGDCDRSEPETAAEAAGTATDPLNIVEHLIERRRCQNNHGGEHLPDKFQEPVAEAIIAERMSQAMRAIAYVHGLGYLHGGIDPELL